jgi:hypothetical protein
MMDAGHLMMVMILGGFALCGVHFRAQYTDWRNQQTADCVRNTRVRKLYQDRRPPYEDGRKELRLPGSGSDGVH